MPYAPNRTTGYTSISDWLDANRGTLGNEAGAVSTDINNQLDAAKAAADTVAAGAMPGVEASAMPGYQAANDLQTNAQNAANALSSSGGVQADLAKTPYGQTPGDRSFEGQLLSIAGAQPFADTRAKAQTLSDYLGTTTAAAQRPLGSPMDKSRQRTKDPNIPEPPPPPPPSTDIPPGYAQPRDDEGNPTGPPVPIPPPDNPGGALRTARPRTLTQYLQQ